MRKWIDQSTFDELLLANAEDNIERAIQSASAVLEAVHPSIGQPVPVTFPVITFGLYSMVLSSLRKIYLMR